jgi:hypothetical protein
VSGSCERIDWYCTNVPSAPVGVVSITVPERGGESEVLDRFEAACEAEGYEGSVTVTCEVGGASAAVSSSWSGGDGAVGGGGRWEVSGSCDRADWYCTQEPAVVSDVVGECRASCSSSSARGVSSCASGEACRGVGGD